MPYLRTGSCKRCGGCCDLRCSHFYWEVQATIAVGTRLTQTGFGTSLLAGCDIDGMPEQADPSLYGGGCAGYPTQPECTPESCGYEWVQVDDYSDPSGVYYPPKPEEV